MNSFVNKFSQFFGSKDLSNYPELYNKKEVNHDLNYRILTASNAVFYDNSIHANTIDWKEI
jgi:hypothetical protein